MSNGKKKSGKNHNGILYQKNKKYHMKMFRVVKLGSKYFAISF